MLWDYRRWEGRTGLVYTISLGASQYKLHLPHCRHAQERASAWWGSRGAMSWPPTRLHEDWSAVPCMHCRPDLVLT